MYELTNVIADDIKSVLQDLCHLSLPQVMQTTPEGLDMAHVERVSELVFDCQNQPLFLSLWKR